MVLFNRPAKAFITNLSSGERREFLFNPSELNEEYGAEYKSFSPFSIPGRPLQYTGSPNPRYKIDLVVDQIAYERFDDKAIGNNLTSVDINGVPKAESFRRFLISLLHPKAGQQFSGGVLQQLAKSPPEILFVWPGILSMICVIKNLRFKHKIFFFGHEGFRKGTRLYTATLDIEALFKRRLTSSDITFYGITNATSEFTKND